MTPSAESTKFRYDVTGDGSVSMFVSTNQSAGSPGTSESVRKSACIQFEKNEQHQVWNDFAFIRSVSFYKRFYEWQLDHEVSYIGYSLFYSLVLFSRTRDTRSVGYFYIVFEFSREKVFNLFE